LSVLKLDGESDGIKTDSDRAAEIDYKNSEDQRAAEGGAQVAGDLGA
jgi:hypothetical protein